MGRPDLLESLERRGQEQMEALARQAHDEEDRLLQEQSRLREQCRCEHLQKLEGAMAALREEILAGARREAALIRLESESELAARLHALARRLLPGLRGQGYEEAFESLCLEIPSGTWSRIHVHPQDVHPAQKVFTSAQVLSDGTITGGLVAEDSAGDIRILNTLEKRLELAWEELLPRLLEALRVREDSDAMD